MRNAILLSLALSNPPVRCCDVSFLLTLSFPFLPHCYFYDILCHCRRAFDLGAIIGTCLDFAAEDRQVTERNAALEKMSAGVETLWSDPRRRSVVVLL
jgi:hypothetical protein